MARLRKAKYGNKKVVIDGIKFDSIAEGNRYIELKAMLSKGIITDLKLQESFVLAKSVTFHDGKKKRSMRYVADFTYYRDGLFVIEDVKGMETVVYKMKKHLMKSYLDLDITEIKRK